MKYHNWPGFPGGTSGKELTCQCRRHKRSGLIPVLARSPGEYWMQPHSVFLPGESFGQRSLVGYSPQGRTCRTRLKRLSTQLYRFTYLGGKKMNPCPYLHGMIEMHASSVRKLSPSSLHFCLSGFWPFVRQTRESPRQTKVINKGNLLAYTNKNAKGR